MSNGYTEGPGVVRLQNAVTRKRSVIACSYTAAKTLPILPAINKSASLS